MPEKRKFMVFNALFLFEVRIQQKRYLTGENFFLNVITRKKTEHCKIMKKSIMVAVVGCIKGFLIIC